MAMAICLRRRWKCLLFDVSTAFLSGKDLTRDLCVRPPHDLKRIHAGELWQILRSAYGLSEAPRLWYMKAKEDLSRCGFEELVRAGYLCPPHAAVWKTGRDCHPLTSCGCWFSCGGRWPDLWDAQESDRRPLLHQGVDRSGRDSR